MTPHTLLRWSSLAALVAGSLKIVIAFFHYFSFPPDLSRSAVMTLSAWQIQQAVDLAGKMLFLWALVGLYSRQAKETGLLGLVGYLTLFTGFMLSFGTQWGFFIFGPDLAKAAPAVLDSDIPSGLLGNVALLFPFVLAGLGLILFGLATLRAKVYPRPLAALLLLIPAVGGALLLAGVGGIGFLAGDVAFGAGIGWMGYFLWREKVVVPRARAAALA
jgi:hypothetical protein